jgi:hypothetical protein
VRDLQAEPAVEVFDPASLEEAVITLLARVDDLDGRSDCLVTLVRDIFEGDLDPTRSSVRGLRAHGPVWPKCAGL